MSRRSILVLAALLLLAPLALAQTAAPIRVDLADWAQPIQPLGQAPPAAFVVTVDCTTLVAQERALVHVWVSSAPSFATVTVSPASFPLDANGCRARGDRFEGVAIATLQPEAPAYRPQTIQISAAIEGLATSGNVSASDVGTLVPAYFSILDVQVRDAIVETQPGGEVRPMLVATNNGNGRTTVSVLVADAGQGLTVEPPAETTLDSAAQGGVATQAELAVLVRASDEGGAYVNRVTAVTLRVVADDAEGNGKGEETTVSLVVTVRGLNETPGAPLALSLVLVLALALALARR